MIVGDFPAPMAVLIFALYASFWNSVYEIVPVGLAASNALTAFSRMLCCGFPDRNQYVALPVALPPAEVGAAPAVVAEVAPLLAAPLLAGLFELHAARAAATGTP